MGEPELAEHLGRPQAVEEAGAGGVGRELDQQLRGERQRVQRDMVPGRQLAAAEHEHDRRAERERRVGGRQQQPARREVAAHGVGGRRGQVRGGDEQRDVRRREQEQHRHEHQLRRDRVAGARRELDPPGERVGGHERDRHRQRQLARGRREDRQRQPGGQEAAGEQERAQPLSPRQRLLTAFEGFLDAPLGGGVQIVFGCGHP
jgi:hypothetical protein